MNKAELVKAVAGKTEMTQKDVAKVLDAITASIQQGLAKGEKIQIIGFGSFEVRDRKERKVISPATKKEILVPATKVPAFRPGKALKEAVVVKKEAAKKSKSKKK